MSKTRNEAEQVEYDLLVDEFIAKGGPTIGQIKKCGLKSPEKVARLIELGWVDPSHTSAGTGPDEDKSTLSLDVIELSAGVRQLLIAKTVYDRAKKLGMNDDQILAYPDGASVVRFCNSISPQSNPEAKVKLGGVSEKEETEKDTVPASIKFTSEMESKFMSNNRNSFDENTLQAKLREINRKYGAQKPVKIVKTSNMEQVDGKNKNKQNCKVLVTEFEVFYK